MYFCSRLEQRDVQVTKVVHIKRFPVGGGFYAINLFGVIFAVERLTPVELNHERIHTAQQRELGFVGFYLWYVVEWLCLLVKYCNAMEAYYHIRFEREAYRHQGDMSYLRHRRHYRYGQ